MAADDSIVGRIADGARNRLDGIREALMAEMRLRLSRLHVAPDGTLQGEREALDAARTIRSQLITIMRKEGLPVVLSTADRAVVDAVDAVLGPPIVRHAKNLVAGVDVSTDAEAMASIERSVSGVLDEVVTVFGDGADAVRDAVDVGLSTAAPLDKVVENVASALDTTFAKASVAVDSAVRAAGQLAIVQQAERGAEATGEALYLLYSGPEDSKTRDWCEAHLDRVYSVDDVRRMVNDFGQPALTWRGGFSCRHRWSPISRDDAVAEGYRVESA